MVIAPKAGFARTLFATVALGAMTVSGTLSMGTPPAIAAQGPASVADLAEGLLDAVVNISTSQTVKGDGEGDGAVPMPQVPEGSPFQEYFKDFFGDNGGAQGDESRKVQSLGSGFVIDAEKGFIVTNNHVIADADEIEVNFNDGSKLKAELVGKDIKTDLAILKVDPSKHKLKAVQFGNSEKARIGDWVLAIGNPFGLGGTVTAGIISARKRDINSGPYDDFIQTDAAINRGNSGGPLFDMEGKVIGINTAIISPSGGSIGIGFAIPAEMAVGVIDQLKEFGEVRRGWLGVRIQPVTDDIAQSLGLKEAKGALVAGLIENSGVDNKAIEAGDVVIRYEGKPVNTARDLPRLVAETPVGKEVEIVVVRQGEEKTVKVKLGRLVEDDKSTEAATEDQAPLPEGEGGDEGKQMPDTPKKDQKSDAAPSVLGMKLSELSDEVRGEFGIAEDVEGVAVLYVSPGSAAGEKRIETGDVIVDIGQVTVKTPDDVKKRIDALRREGRKNALLMLASRSGELRFVTVRIN
ncbi:Do family serine endopeptidase [Brucella intermedia]|uniref:Do family serine endopeptidase n=1 Tax=Brucella TaxID=234 RepID=UPI0007C39C24|nr:Do family serine endopeptidase [Brucella intermedia]PJT27307.1 serine protease [Ochrobactrum sp. 30A/1000/2015]PJT38728.1 serine protease [Ochrobactrum sp. 27A/999/2015]PJT44744.1 serine protease [Ochrobactrum sp. 23A/997/2015]KAB2714772.1 Do family serine endopeptidase [Brucella intermedia]MDL2203941.1 Do family serine endopeptidase [Brucella intermedia]